MYIEIRCLQVFMMSGIIGQSVLACVLTPIDQVQLLEFYSEGKAVMPKSVPVTGEPIEEVMGGLEGSLADCFVVGSLRFVYPHHGRTFYILDTAKVFDRWENRYTQGQASVPKYMRFYLQDWLAWLRARSNASLRVEGRTALSEVERDQIDRVMREGMPSPIQIRIGRREDFRELDAEQVGVGVMQLLSRLLVAEVVEYLYRERKVAWVGRIEVGSLRKISTFVVVRVATQAAEGTHKEMVLRVAVNPNAPPYVGSIIPLNPL